MIELIIVLWITCLLCLGIKSFFAVIPLLVLTGWVLDDHWRQALNEEELCQTHFKRSVKNC